jgi:hypothetical protein
MDPEKVFSRREMLRNIGIAGAVAWAAPVLSSLPAHASIEGHRRVCKKACKGQGECCQGFGCVPCSSQTNCPSELGDGAYCFHSVGGKLVCAPDVFCTVPRCLTSLDCKSNEVCVTLNGCDGCTGSFAICAPRCRRCRLTGGSPRKQFVRMGRTAAGQ